MYKNFFSIVLLLIVLGISFSPVEVQAVACAQSGTTGAVTLTGTNCTLASTVVGADVAASSTDTTNTGSLTIPAGTTMTLNAGDTLVFGSGGLLVSGSITKLGGAMQKGGIWVTDADGDRYYASNTLQFSVTRPGTKVRLGWAPTVDSSDVSACPAGQTMGCQYCLNGATANVTNGTDPYSNCGTTAISCATLCTRTSYSGMCNGAGACATVNASTPANQVCTGAGNLSVAQCQAGYNCNGAGRCCYTDIYGEHCVW